MVVPGEGNRPGGGQRAQTGPGQWEVRLVAEAGSVEHGTKNTQHSFQRESA